MLTKSALKFLRSLEHKKYRSLHRAFIVEGNKAVESMAGSYTCRMLLAHPSWIESHPEVVADEIIALDRSSLSRLSLMPSPPEVVAVFHIPSFDISDVNPEQNIVLVLDGVQDPGNLGTIVRIADWFGVEHIVCSPSCADIFAPKAIQAAMGAVANVQLHYVSLSQWLSSVSSGISIYGTYPSGRSIYRHPLSSSGIILMGSEGQGISSELERHISHRISIPPPTNHHPAADSLNVAIATAIVCAEFRRREP
ncbi:MAG: RNA methyltransferase [Tannerellaceae bacterium]|jgi:TrmH family RNA methyltransferase|nr:RNA methyltransferase [Tannerellaceae bacterium]